ncbi:MAG: valine--tRNA ligase [Bacteroidota bacterium]
MQKKSAYHHQEVESKWSSFWEKEGYFRSQVNKNKEPYVLIMPPPNVTGILHMGHLLNNTVQDVLARKARMAGKEVCWVPGTDHASIATEAKVLEKLEKKGLTKAKLGKQAFLKEAWQWKKKHEDIIIHQLKRLGISCDWERSYFTMDTVRSDSVTAAFVKLHEEGYIYRGTRMIHWDPKRETALADEEVVYREVTGQLYYIRYALAESSESIVIATTRPETILGDTAIAVHPEDKRYQHLHGKQAIIPLTNRKIPIIADSHVDPLFGTGCLKITPAHDPYDYELGKKHGLAIINIMHPNGSLNENAGHYQNLDRVAARKKIVADLHTKRLLVRKEQHIHQVGFSERSNAIVEPRISTQWFVRMQQLAQPAIKAVQNHTIQFHPAKFINMYNAWMHNIKEWCISRQLWWGHPIPVYYLKDGRYVVAHTAEEALKKAQLLTNNPTLTSQDIQQDRDVLDTWFSSWLLPLSAFNGILDPHSFEIQYFYPTDSLVTAPEIIFFWVARMIIAGYYFHKKPPFRHVYFTGIVRDQQRRKMSKSLGNSPDLLNLMDRYSVDGMRAGILLAAPAGNDLLFDEKLCEQGYQFVHKINNALTLVTGWHLSPITPTTTQQLAVHWFQARLQEILHQIEELFTSFRLSDALMAVYKLIWNDFCSHYLEMIKPRKTKQIAESIGLTTQSFFLDLMKVLHPFMPFITEEVASRLASHTTSLALENYPILSATFDHKILAQAQKAFTLISRLRQYRTQTPWSDDQGATLCWSGESTDWLATFTPYIQTATKIAVVQKRESVQPTGKAIIMEGTIFWVEGVVSTSTKKQTTYEKELAYQKKFLLSIERKLNNKQFIANAPSQVIMHEKKKKKDTQARIHSLQQLLQTEK